ncbi:lamin tail domain-containing protein [bacterium]|nr:lamin tail domain-containing protein [bacterium]
MSLGSIRYLANLSLLIAAVPALLASPVINELMFHAPGNPAEDTREEWIELYNTSKTSINVSGWRFTKGIDFTTPEGTQLPANGFLIVAADTATFRTAHPDINPDVIGNWIGRLSNDSETITLTNADGNPVDQLDYATQGDWGLRTQSAPEKEITGWIWENKADGDGHSLEKRQPLVRLSSGMAWALSTEAGGTPGATNSTFTENLAPVIQDVAHEPIIPRSSDTITITAQVTDDADPSTVVSLFYRIDGDQPWQQQAMHDNNSIHDTIIGPFTSKVIIEYYVEAQDAEEQKHFWPRPSKKSGVWPNVFDAEAFEQFNNALVQVDDAYHLNSWEPGSPPRYRIIMTAEQRDLLKKAQDLSSRSVHINVAFHATFVSEDGTGVKARHNAAVRDRGFSSRSGPPVNYHVAFPSGDRWNECKSIQLNSRFPFSHALGAAMFQLAGLSTTEAVPVEVFVNGVITADTAAVGYAAMSELNLSTETGRSGSFQMTQMAISTVSMTMPL